MASLVRWNSPVVGWDEGIQHFGKHGTVPTHFRRGMRTHHKMGGTDRSTYRSTYSCLHNPPHWIVLFQAPFFPSRGFMEVDLRSLLHFVVYDGFVLSFPLALDRTTFTVTALARGGVTSLLRFPDEIPPIASGCGFRRSRGTIHLDGWTEPYWPGASRGERGGGRLWLAHPRFSLVERVRTDRASTNPRAFGIFRGSPRTSFRWNPRVPFKASFRAFLSSLSNATWNHPTHRQEIPSRRHNHVDERTAHRKRVTTTDQCDPKRQMVAN